MNTGFRFMLRQSIGREITHKRRLNAKFRSYAKFLAWPAVAAALLVTAQPVRADPAGTDVPRIVVRHGQFINSVSGALFVPIGFNFYRLGNDSEGKPGHGEFLVGNYDPAFIDKMMADAQSWGFNTIRTWQCFIGGPNGIVSSPDAREISPGYLANVIDFLRKARSHNLRVIFSWDPWAPPSNPLGESPLLHENSLDLRDNWDAGEGFNNIHWNRTYVRQRINAETAIILAIKAREPSLLNVVLGWEVENEIFLNADSAPFNEKSGHFEFSGQNYDLSSDTQKQQLQNAIVLQFCNAAAEAIHFVDPLALVSVSVFTPNDVGRQAYHFSQDVTTDNRLPAFPLALVHSGLDYLDVHNYGFVKDGKTVPQNLAANLSSVSWTQLSSQAALAGKPILCGETGVYPSCTNGPPDWSKTSEVLAGASLKQEVEGLKAAGYAGALYWKYGCPESSLMEPNPPLRFYPRLALVLREAFLPANSDAGTVPQSRPDSNSTGAASIPGRSLLSDSNSIGSWTLRQFNATAADLSGEDGALKIDVTQVDGNEFDVGILQTGIPLATGNQYILRFRAKADAARKIAVIGIHSREDFRNVGLQAVFPLKTAWQTYQTTFTATRTDGKNHNIPRFSLGQQTGTVWLRDISLVQITAPGTLPDGTKQRSTKVSKPISTGRLQKRKTSKVQPH